MRKWIIAIQYENSATTYRVLGGHWKAGGEEEVMWAKQWAVSYVYKVSGLITTVFLLFLFLLIINIHLREQHCGY